MKSMVASDDATCASTAAWSGPPIILRKSMLFSSDVKFVVGAAGRSPPRARSAIFSVVRVASAVPSCAAPFASFAFCATSRPVAVPPVERRLAACPAVVLVSAISVPFVDSPWETSA
jgi:hypothetical protein